ncbi:hypothetical protein HanRHA438_Chr15g0728091 [Helianthus annuus]|nr:hypothetical protein HanRHA438_Chr15g0728091 [Helianthus annuus]
MYHHDQPLPSPLYFIFLDVVYSLNFLAMILFKKKYLIYGLKQDSCSKRM